MAPLVAAVSNAGGLGVIGAATLSADGLRREIRKTRELTDKPFAVDLLAPIPEMIRPYMQVLFEEKVEIFVAGLAVPREFIAEMHARAHEGRGDDRQGQARRARGGGRARTSWRRRERRPAATRARSARWRSCRRWSTR